VTAINRRIVPVLDLAESFSGDASARRAVAALLGTYAREYGVFHVVNHRVPPSAIAAHFELARAFFALDAGEKRAIDVRRSNCFRGYEPFGTQTIASETPGDLKEGFIMGPDLESDHPHVVAKFPNTGENLWPARPRGFETQMRAWVAHMNELGRHLARCLALSLDLDEAYFERGLADPLTYSQLFHYPPQPPGAATARLGAGAHVDWGMLTILLQDDVGGLEVRAEDGAWHPAPPVPGALVVILGEMIPRLTNGRYRSATHRVVANTSGRSRYSMPTFVDPDYDYRVACVPTCYPAAGEPRFAPCTVSEHMIAMSREQRSHASIA
jgi:isopenicillin N synthase-like dioxygenase